MRHRLREILLCDSSWNFFSQYVKFLLTRIEGQRTEDVVHCTDCEAHLPTPALTRWDKWLLTPSMYYFQDMTCSHQVHDKIPELVWKTLLLEGECGVLLHVLEYMSELVCTMHFVCYCTWLYVCNFYVAVFKTKFPRDINSSSWILKTNWCGKKRWDTYFQDQK